MMASCVQKPNRGEEMGCDRGPHRCPRDQRRFSDGSTGADHQRPAWHDLGAESAARDGAAPARGPGRHSRWPGFYSKCHGKPLEGYLSHRGNMMFQSLRTMVPGGDG